MTLLDKQHEIIAGVILVGRTADICLNSIFNSFKPGVPFVGHRQTE